MPCSYAARSFNEDAQSLIDEAEDKFKRQNLQQALSLAITAKQRNPQFDGIDKFIAAYGVHVAAVRKGPRSEIDFYGVLGVVDPLADTKTIKKNYSGLALMVHPDKNPSAAADGAFKHILAAWEVLSEPSKRLAYDLRWGPRPSTSSTPTTATEAPRKSNSWTRYKSNSWTRFGGRTCPTCYQWCNYEDGSRSSIHCSNCRREYDFGSSSSTRSGPGTGDSSGASVPPDFSSTRGSSGAGVPPDSSSTKTGSSGASVPPDSSSTETSSSGARCPFCNGEFVYQSAAEKVSTRCESCKFGFVVPSEQGWRYIVYNSGPATIFLKREL
ncbi:hypothetical protein L1049_017243 [Liquidambar formosana]|uniref:J domain-containing protein n=1 Tax=Liquidambar formosana TaxID=63359 RepID=A0AAP0S2S5_LIQFO